MRSSPEVEAAIDEAYAAPRDLGTWRVLADLLLSLGDPRGEWMQLELDAEVQPLRGLAKGRRQRLAEEVGAWLLPPGVHREGARTWRGLLVAAEQQVSSAREPDDPRWTTVRQLDFAREPAIEPHWQWARTPLGGTRLARLVELRGFPEHALDRLATAPLPRLERLRLWWPRREDPTRASAWAARWRGVQQRFPKLERLHLGHPDAEAEALARLEAVLAAPLREVSLTAQPEHLRALWTWVRSARPPWTLRVMLLGGPVLGVSVELGAEQLLVRGVDAAAALATKEVVLQAVGGAGGPAVSAELVAEPVPWPT